METRQNKTRSIHLNDRQTDAYADERTRLQSRGSPQNSGVFLLFKLVVYLDASVKARITCERPVTCRSRGLCARSRARLCLQAFSASGDCGGLSNPSKIRNAHYNRPHSLIGARFYPNKRSASSPRVTILTSAASFAFRAVIRIFNITNVSHPTRRRLAADVTDRRT